MRASEIEYWALTVIDAVKRGDPTEDMRVELKAEWPTNAPKAARQIAGHANAAAGENILWLIGVDEAKGVVGAPFAEQSTWWPMVQRQFAELAPAMRAVNVPVDGNVAVALLFETDRAPFVVKNPVFGSPDGGSVELEVPWREGTSVRSARRADLIRLLVPAQELPSIEVQDCTLTLSTPNMPSAAGKKDPPDDWTVSWILYIVPASGATVVIPYHYCRMEFEVQGVLPVSALARIHGSDGRPTTVGFSGPMQGRVQEAPRREMIIDRPMEIYLHGYVRSPVADEDGLEGTEANVRAELRPTKSARSVVVRSKLRYKEVEARSLGNKAWTWSRSSETPAPEYSIIEAS